MNYTPSSAENFFHWLVRRYEALSFKTNYVKGTILNLYATKGSESFFFVHLFFAATSHKFCKQAFRFLFPTQLGGIQDFLLTYAYNFLSALPRSYHPLFKVDPRCRDRPVHAAFDTVLNNW